MLHFLIISGMCQEIINLDLPSYINVIAAAVKTVASPSGNAHCRMVYLGLMGSPWFFEIKTSVFVAYSSVMI